jgi:hypothetical protein
MGIGAVGTKKLRAMSMAWSTASARPARIVVSAVCASSAVQAGANHRCTVAWTVGEDR